ncbi:MAG: hypothetical protein LCH54_15885 [Bacteroidetes bacterium]|nr:hypothetical protein [Bacteroidota bacterium]
MKLRNLLFLLFLASIFSSCSFGEREGNAIEDILAARDEAKNSGTVASKEWVNVAIWKGAFQTPVDVLYGFDKLVYVADSSGSVYQYDENGTLLGFYSLVKAEKLGMDRALNLFIIGRIDTTIGRSYNLPAIYCLDMTSTSQILKNSTRILKRIVHPFYFNPSGSGLNEAEKVSFAGIANFADNSFFVARKGPNNFNATALGGYDNTLVQFSKTRDYQGTFSNELDPGVGDGLKFFNDPVSLTSYAAPPQSNSVSSSKDFIYGIKSRSFYRVQGLKVTDEGLLDIERKYLNQDTTKATRFLYGYVQRDGNFESRFRNPADITIAADKHQFILVVDSELDSLYQFNLSGQEGETPDFGKKNLITSFGGTGTGTKQFNRPKGVAYGKLKLFIADTGNKRIMVYKLSTDITQN